ncbi:hypothetical protein P3T40_008054 [Paraburkholderia sp. EB58]
MSGVSTTSSGNDRIETWKTPWTAQREKAQNARTTDEPVLSESMRTAPASMNAKRLELRRRRRLMYAPAAFAGFTLLLIASHQGRVLELFFPAGALAVASLLYKRSPAHYLSFVYWLYFLTPEVRRLSDYFNGTFNERSLIMLAPVMAAALCSMNLLTHFPVLLQRRAIPLTLIMLGILYGYVIGMVGTGIAAATFELISWLFPVLIGFHVLVNWRQYPDYYRTMLKTFIFGGLVIASYGVVQYVNPPAWDAFWLLHSGMKSEGVPLPFSMRVASTMNSSGPFASTMMVCLLMNRAARNKVSLLVSVVAVPAFIGTMVRAAFGGLLVGLLYLFIMAENRSRLRLAGGLAAIVLLCSPVAMVDNISQQATTRLATITQLKTDNSYQARAEIYQYFLSEMTTNIAGRGLGAVGLGSKLSDDSDHVVDFDSGLMEVPYVLGWPGTLLYVGGLLMLVYRTLVANMSNKPDGFALANAAGAFGILSMMVFAHTLLGASGMFFFVGMLLPLAERRYVREMQRAVPAVARERFQPHSAPAATVEQLNIASPVIHGG